MRRIIFAAGVFFVAALVGPLIGYLRLPLWKFKETIGGGVYRFVDDLALLLWPTGPLAVVESSIGPVAAGALVIGANIFLFAVIGLIAGMLAKRRSWLLFVYLLLCALILLVALWGAGFSTAHLSWPALVVALGLYAIPFWIVDRKYNQQRGFN